MRALAICAYRNPQRAVIWFWDPMGLFLALLLYGMAHFALPFWPAVAGAVGMSCWFARVSVTRERPDVVSLTNWLLIFPVRWRNGALATLCTDDEEPSFTLNVEKSAPNTLLILDRWQLTCSPSLRIDEWIRASATAFKQRATKKPEPDG